MVKKFKFILVFSVISLTILFESCGSYASAYSKALIDAKQSNNNQYNQK